MEFNNSTVEITGVNEKNKQYAELFFEINAKSGGGPMASFQYQGPGSNTAIITFKDSRGEYAY